MGAPETEAGRANNESPQHAVVIARAFAVAKDDLTFEEWDACVAVGGCPAIDDTGMKRGSNPSSTSRSTRRYITLRG